MLARSLHTTRDWSEVCLCMHLFSPPGRILPLHLCSVFSTHPPPTSHLADLWLSLTSIASQVFFIAHGSYHLASLYCYEHSWHAWSFRTYNDPGILFSHEIALLKANSERHVGFLSSLFPNITGHRLCKCFSQHSEVRKDKIES